MSNVYVVGVGMTTFGRHKDVPAPILGRDAVLAAIADAGVDRKQIQATYAAASTAGSSFGQRIAKYTGVSRVPTTNVENACASGSTALHNAVIAIESGRYDLVLAVGVESLSTRPSGPFVMRPDDFEGSIGLTMPAVYAMRAQRYMNDYGVDRATLAQVAVKNRANAVANPHAQMRQTVTVEEVLGSRMISDPLTLLQCCPRADGAAATIVCSESYARRITSRPVRIRASQLSSGSFTAGFRDMTGAEISRRAATEAYEMAGVGPEDIDLAEIHDAFTISELMYYEALQFCERGGSGAYLRSGATAIGGARPVNPSGGLLAKGHPLGATGLGQVAEMVWQLRGEASGNQVEGARVGICHCTGGGVSGYDHASASIHILGF